MHVGGFAFAVDSGTDEINAVSVSVLVLFTDRHFSPVNVLLILLQVMGHFVCLSVYLYVYLSIIL